MLTKKQIKANIEYLESKGFSVFENEEDYELENYTSAGGDMIITLEELSRKELTEYAENFDINQEVAIWWPYGQRGNGVPFDNMRDHYNDLEKWLNNVKKVSENMPY